MAIPVDDTYKNGYFDRPSDDIDPKLKQNDPVYSLRFMEFMYSEYCLGRTAITPDDIGRFKINLSYARGQQSTELYKDLILDELRNSPDQLYQQGGDAFNPPKNKKARSGFVSIDFSRIYSPIPKYINNIIGIMEEQEHAVVAQAIDERSGDLREQLKFRRYIEGKLKEELREFDNIMGVQQDDQGIVYPTSIEELALHEQMGSFKLEYESGIQRALKHTLLASNDKKIKRRVIKDILTYGITATMDYFDYNIDEVRVKHTNVMNLIVENSDEEDFSDASYWGYMDFITISELKNETGLLDDELFGIAGNYLGTYGNSTEFNRSVGSDGFYDFYKCRVPVLVGFWRSNDYDYRTKRITSTDEEMEFPEPYRRYADGKSKRPRIYLNGKKETYRTSKKSLYSAKWVLGTELVYDYGLAHDVGFDYGKKDVEAPIHIYKIDEVPMVESCIPIENQLQLTFYRLQNGIAKAPPPGLKIEYNALMGMTFEDDQEWKPLDTIRMYTQSGHFIFNASPDGVQLPANYSEPIGELKGGLGTVIDDAIKSFELGYQQLMEITGIDRLSSVSKNPTGEQGKFVTQVAVAATSNTLRPIYSGYLSIKQQMAKGIILRVQGACYTREKSPYEKILGASSFYSLKTAGNDPPVILGVHLVPTPDSALKEEVRQAAMSALAGGKNGIPALTYSEYLFIVENLTTMAGISFARIYIARKEAEAKIEEQKKANEAVKLNNEATQQQNQQKSDLKNQEILAERDKELAIIEAKKQAQIEIDNNAHVNKLAEIEKEKSYEVEKQSVDSNN